MPLTPSFSQGQDKYEKSTREKRKCLKFRSGSQD